VCACGIPACVCLGFRLFLFFFFVPLGFGFGKGPIKVRGFLVLFLGIFSIILLNLLSGSNPPDQSVPCKIQAWVNVS